MLRGILLLCSVQVRCVISGSLPQLSTYHHQINYNCFKSWPQLFPARFVAEDALRLPNSEP